VGGFHSGNLAALILGHQTHSGDFEDAGQEEERTLTKITSFKTGTQLKSLFHHPSSVIREGKGSTKTPF